MRGTRRGIRTQRTAPQEQVTATHGQESQSRGKSTIRGARHLKADFTLVAGSEHTMMDLLKKTMRTNNK